MWGWGVCLLVSSPIASSAASQCYYDGLMLLKWKLMILKCQINTNTNKKGFLHPTKCLERFLKYSYLVSIISNYQFPKQCLQIFHYKTKWCYVVVALTHLNSTEKLHRLYWCVLKQEKEMDTLWHAGLYFLLPLTNHRKV